MARIFASLGQRLLGRWSPKRFLRDQSGVTAIEFGLLAVPFFVIIGAILETSIVFLAGQVLDSAVGDASRRIRTGQAAQAGFNTAKFESLICGELFGLFDCSGLYSSVTLISDFASATVAAPVQASCQSSCSWTQPDKYDAGQGSSTILVQVYYKWPIRLDFAGLGLADLADQTRLMASVQVFRNEPF